MAAGDDQEESGEKQGERLVARAWLADRERVRVEKTVNENRWLVFWMIVAFILLAGVISVFYILNSY